MSLEQYLAIAEKKLNICADNCATPIYDCPWLHEGKPREMEETYHIFDCPLRIPQPKERLKKQAETDRGYNAMRTFY